MQIGDEKSIMVGRDPWLPNTNQPYVTRPIPEVILEIRVCDLLVADQRAWDVSKVESLFCPSDVESILKILLSLHAVNDDWMWIYERSRKYTVHSGYKALFQVDEEPPTLV